MAEIHGAFGADAQQPVAVGHVVVREAELLGAEEQRHRRRRQALADQSSAVFDRAKGVLQFAMAERCGSDHEAAIGDRLGQRREFFGIAQDLVRVHRGTSLLKRDVIRVHQPQSREAEVAHGSRCRADVERVARGDQDDPQVVVKATARDTCSR